MSTTTTKTPDDPKPLYAITKTTLFSSQTPSPEQEATDPGEEEEEEKEEERITSTEIHAIYADREAANRAARVLLRDVAARAGRLGRHGNLLGRYGESMGGDFMYFGELVLGSGEEVEVEGVQQEGRKRRRSRVEVRVLGVWGYL